MRCGSGLLIGSSSDLRADSNSLTLMTDGSVATGFLNMLMRNMLMRTASWAGLGAYDDLDLLDYLLCVGSCLPLARPRQSEFIHPVEPHNQSALSQTTG